jgi:hypothetical protein
LIKLSAIQASKSSNLYSALGPDDPSIAITKEKFKSLGLSLERR